MIYVYLANGFEEVEALTVVDVLRRAECEVQTVSITADKLVTGRSNITVQTDITFDEADHSTCEMIVLPGGMPGAANLQNFKPLEKEILDFAKSGKKLAAICAAPMVFGALGLVDGKKATIYPGMEDELKGADKIDAGAVVDGNIITGQGPAKAMEFALALVNELKGAAVTESVAAGLLYK